MATNMKSLNGYGFDASALGGKAPEYYLQPRNLLDNSDFRNPVNQRGITTTDSSFTGYVLDRWIAQNSGTLVTLDSNGLNVAASSGAKYLFQRLDNVKNGKTYTFAAALSDGTIGVCAFTLSSTTSKWEWIKEVHVSSSFHIAAAHSDWMPLFVAMSNLTDTSARIIWAALYEGSYTAETLPPYVPKGYAAELAECQMYCLVTDYATSRYLSGYGATSSATVFNAYFKLAMPMRTTPSLSNTDGSLWTIDIGGTRFTPTEASIWFSSQNAILGIKFTISGATARKPGIVSINTDKKIIISCDL